MKRLFSYISVFTMTVCLASCSNAEEEHHSTYFYPTDLLSVDMYADQSETEVTLVSLDTWTAAAEGGWFTISPNEARVPAGYQLTQNLKITASPNTTGLIRTGLIRVQAYSNLAMAVRQVPWLDIRRPAQYISSGEKEGDPLVVTCEVTVNSDAATLPLHFVTYAPDATLVSDQPWITIEEATFEAGENKPVLGLQPNTDTEARTANLTLTSAGIAAKIKVTQLEKQSD